MAEPHEIMEALRGLRASAHDLHRKVDSLMTGIEDLKSAIANLAAAETAESDELIALHDSLVKAEAQISALQAAVASGSIVTDSDLETLATTVAGIASAAQQATAAAAPAPTEPPATPPPPAAPPAEPPAGTTPPVDAPPSGTTEPPPSGTDQPPAPPAP